MLYIFHYCGRPSGWPRPPSPVGNLPRIYFAITRAIGHGSRGSALGEVQWITPAIGAQCSPSTRHLCGSSFDRTPICTAR